MTSNEKTTKAAAPEKAEKAAEPKETKKMTEPEEAEKKIAREGGKKPEEMTDRLGEYLKPHLDDYIFDELSDSYLEKAGVLDVMHGVPVPIRKDSITGLTNVKIAQNMAFVIGCDINFKYRDNYVEYIVRTFTRDFAKPLINSGIEAAQKSDFDAAVILFRAALLIDPDSTDALYCYGRACRDSYAGEEGGMDEGYVARYKAESLEAFEKLTLKAPEFDMGYYFLGYAYLNLGLYQKAKLTFEEFVRLSNRSDDPAKAEMRAEVLEWLDKLKEPIKIEAAYNKVLSGKFYQGIEELLPYTEDERYENWWPLWYYLGYAYRKIGEPKMAEAAYKKVLTLSPSNIDVMRELSEVYAELGDKENEAKYIKKIQVVRENIKAERRERLKKQS
ncbi:MAG: tetratricopeptide repeat protein [Eubacterium sp.]|jgi:tetratricopeptide (TPR) repeat protein